MLDAELQALVRAKLLAALPARGLPTALVIPSDQPRNQGRQNGTAIYFKKVFERRIGSRKISSAWDEDLEAMVETETQAMESTYQFNAMVEITDPADDMVITSGDVVKKTAAIMQSPSFQKEILAEGINVLRISEVRNMSVKNDREQFEYVPSFDITFTYADIFAQEIRAIDSAQQVIHRV